MKRATGKSGGLRTWKILSNEASVCSALPLQCTCILGAAVRGCVWHSTAQPHRPCQAESPGQPACQARRLGHR